MNRIIALIIHSFKIHSFTHYTAINNNQNSKGNVQQQPQKKKRSWGRRLLSIVLILSISIAVFLLVASFVIQIPSVQNRLVDRVAAYLSDELDTKVEVGNIDIRFFDKFLLENFYVEDRQQDTLLFAERLNINVNAFTFFREKKFYVEDITLKKARFNLYRHADSTDFNIAFLEELFVPKKKNTGANPDTVFTSNDEKGWLLKADRLYVDDVVFNLNDESKGTALRVNLPKGEAGFDGIDPAARILNLNQLELTNVQVALRRGTDNSQKRKKKKKEKSNKPWSIQLKKGTLDDAAFTYDDTRRARKEEGLDFNHMNISDINIRVNDFVYENEGFLGDIVRLNLREKSGFKLEKFVASAAMNEKGIELKNLNIRTPHSQFGNQLSLKFRSFDDFKNFEDKVRLNSQLNDAVLSFNDLLIFAPKLEKSKFIRQNIDKEIRLNGLFTGKVNRLKGKDISIQFGDNTALTGSFSTRDITNPDDAFLDVKVERLQTSIKEIKALTNARKLPSNFNKLGDLDFKGRFTGFFLDFVADGRLKTDLGRVNSDLKIDLREGFENAEYSGNLRVIDFDVQTWSGNDLFGTAAFSGKVKGRGVTLKTVDADLDAKLQKFTFKGYDYENVRLDGRLTGKFFDGKLLVEEQDVDMKFVGSVDFRDSLPVFDFTANVDQLKLKNLNLAMQDIQLRGDVKFDFSGSNIDNFVGAASVYSFDFQQDDKKYHADTVVITSDIKGRNNRVLTVDSELANAKIEGEFDVIQLPAAFARYFETNYPKYAQRLNISSEKLAPKKKMVLDTSMQLVERPVDIREQDLRFSLKVRESNDLIDLLVKNVEIVEGTTLEGRFSTRDNVLTMNGKTPRFRIGTVDVFAINLNLLANGGLADLKLETSGLVVGDSAVALPPIFVTGDLQSDTLNFQIETEGYQDVVKDLNVNGVIFPEDDYFQMSVLPSDFFVFSRKWDVSGDNYIRLGKDYVETQNIIIRHKNEEITLNSFGEKGLELNLNNLDVNWLNDIIYIKNTEFDGTLNAAITLGDLFKNENISANVRVDSVLINNDYWGNIRLTAHGDEITSPLETRIRLNMHDTDSLVAVGKFYSPLVKAENVTPNSFDFQVAARNYSVEFVKYLIADISNLRGKFDADARFFGNFKRPQISGKLNIYDAAVKVDYLQTTYFINESDIDLSSTYFNLTNNKIRDDYGNEATMTGGISHDYFKDFRLANLTIDSDQFLLLNTEKKDNPDYYGRGIGAATVTFNGPFDQADINITAVSGENSSLTIPLTDERTAKKARFIEFVAKEDTVKQQSRGLFIKGANLDIKLSVTPQAQVFLSFDERVGDVMRGRGRGDIQVKVTRTGQFSVVGDYEIQEGDYLFTYQNFINKPFRVKPGGTIRWTGDPYDATINVNAIYDGLRVPPYNFILEYLSTDPNQVRSARRTTPIELNMGLVGSLLQPDIHFGINFPNIDPRLRTFTDGKLRILKDDPNELNRQVFGLVVLGNFLPSPVVSTTQQQQYITGINTFSEMLSNQLSNYLTDLLSDVVTDVGFISGIDFDMNYRLYQIEGLENIDIDPTTTRQQVQLGLKNYLFNDRLLVNIGGNLDFNSTYIEEGTNLGSYIAGDFAIEYLLTADGRYKIRAYNRNETGLDFDTQVNETGLGFSYRTEFDNFSEFIDSFFGNVKERRAKRKEKKRSRREAKELGMRE